MVLCLAVVTFAAAIGQTTESIHDGIGSGGTAGIWIKVLSGDRVHVEWQTSQTIHFELSFENSSEGVTYGRPVISGDADSGKYLFQPTSDGKFKLSFTNTASESVRIDATMTATGERPSLDALGILAIAVIATIVIALLLTFLIRRRGLGRREKGA